MIDIKFKPTGHIFSLSESEAERIVNEDRGNYEVVKGKIKEEKPPKTAKSVKELVVVNNDEKTSKNKQKTTKNKKETEKENESDNETTEEKDETENK